MNNDNKNKPYKRPQTLPQLKVELNNLQREFNDLKTKVFSMEHFFASERPTHAWNKIEIVFVDGHSEEFTDVISRKYTLEAKDSKDNLVIIQKSNCLYVRILS